MKIDDLKAEEILDERREIERLRTIVWQPTHKYYLQGNIFVILVKFVIAGVALVYLIRSEIPDWANYLVIVAIISILESVRYQQRFDAFLQLTKILEDKKRSGWSLP